MTVFYRPIPATFVSTWNTANTSAGSSTATQVKLPLESAGTYDFQVDWGDGTSSIIKTWNQAEVTHTYAASGVYIIQIKGIIVGFAFKSSGDRRKIIDVSNWGVLRLGNSTGYFNGCTSLTISAQDVLDLTGTIDLSNVFSACSLLVDVPNIGLWDTQNVTTLTSAFLSSPLFNGDISTWNTRSVQIINSILNNCTSFNRDIGLWNTISLLNAGGALINATSFNRNLGAWNISSLQGAASMLSGVTLSKANYNGLLAGWGAQSTNNNVVFSGGNSHYDAVTGGFNGTAGRLILTGTRGWTITDGGTP